VPAPTHYDTLRVHPAASGSDIREAYRRLARQHHPDRAVTHGSAVAASSMPAINEAYRVLSDPARRAVYDAGLRTAPQSAPSGADPGDRHPGHHGPDRREPAHPSHLGPARFPWRSMLVAAVLGVVGVVVLAQFTEPGEPPGPDGILRVGSCVVIAPDTSVSEVACTGDPLVDVVVDAIVPFDSQCPGAAVPYRDRQGLGNACIVPPRG
jgi:molecular chaperone DnaJ